jgi:hypothetical protein
MYIVDLAIILMIVSLFLVIILLNNVYIYIYTYIAKLSIHIDTVLSTKVHH